MPYGKNKVWVINEADRIPDFAWSSESPPPPDGDRVERRGFDPSSPEARAALPSLSATRAPGLGAPAAGTAVLDPPLIFEPGKAVEPLPDVFDAPPGQSADDLGGDVPPDFPDLVVIPITEVPATPEIFAPGSRLAPSEIASLRISDPEPRPEATSPRRRRPGRAWLAAAYVLGPLVPALLSRGRARTLWSGATCTSFAAIAFALTRSPELAASLGAGGKGALAFLLIQTAAALGVGAAWAAAIASTGQARRVGRSPNERSTGPVAWNAALLGFLVPGLGLQITGHPKRAAWAFGLLGPLAAAAIVLAQAPWLWERTHGDPAAGAGISESALEAVFASAAAVTAASALVWVVQALDGARRASRGRSGAFSGITSLALLASLGIFAFTFRPPAVASFLHTTASELRAEGLQRIPLGLTEVAARLDPAEPAYLAEAVELHESLGRGDLARSTRAVLERRAQEYLRIARRAAPVQEAGFLPVPIGPGMIGGELEGPTPVTPKR